jgi:hypothetical protein
MKPIRIVAPLLVRGEPAGVVAVDRYKIMFDEADSMVISAIALLPSMAFPRIASLWPE